VQRENHSGYFIDSDNPTTHTETFENGDLVWVRADEEMDRAMMEFDFEEYEQWNTPDSDNDGWIKHGELVDIMPESTGATLDALASTRRSSWSAS